MFLEPSTPADLWPDRASSSNHLPPVSRQRGRSRRRVSATCRKSQVHPGRVGHATAAATEWVAHSSSRISGYVGSMSFAEPLPGKLLRLPSSQPSETPFTRPCGPSFPPSCPSCSPPESIYGGLTSLRRPPAPLTSSWDRGETKRSFCMYLPARRDRRPGKLAGFTTAGRKCQGAEIGR